MRFIIVATRREIRLRGFYKGNVPFGQPHEVVLAWTLGEAGDAEPAGLAVILGSTVTGDSVLEDLAARVSGNDLGSVSEVANDADAGNGARSRGAESASSSGGSASGAAEEHRGHFGDICDRWRC